MRTLLVLIIATLGQICFAAQTGSGLYFNTFGDPQNQSLLFVHGGPGYNSWSFEFGAARELAQAGFYVVVYDQRGSGRSPAGQTSDYTFANASKDILEVIQASHADQPILLAHSWGATPAIEFLKLQPGAARAVILAEGVVSWPSLFHSILTNSEKVFEGRGDAPDDQLAKSLIAKMFPNGFTPPYKISISDIEDMFGLAMQKSGIYFPATYTPEAKAIYKQLVARSDNHWMQDDQEAPGVGFMSNEDFYNQDFAGDLMDNSDLIYAIYADEDGLFDPTQIGETASQLPEQHLTVLQGAGHFSFIDQQGAFIQAVKSFTAMAAQSTNSTHRFK